MLGWKKEHSLAALRTAFEIKLSARAFYARAARETEEPVIRELFGKLAAQEQEQMSTLSRRYHVEAPPPSQEFELDRAAIYAGIELQPEDPANLLRIAIACVQRAAKFIGERGERTSAETVAGNEDLRSRRGGAESGWGSPAD